MNTVNEDNLNDTVKGYLIRACEIRNENEHIFDDDAVKKLINALGWSFDEMTCEDARAEYKKYRSGKIKF